MTTLEPGASEVLTHGLARRPAAIITEGLEVLVQLVMAAITTSPWSRSKPVPSESRTGTETLARPLTPVGSGSNQPGTGSPGAGSPLALTAGASLAGKDSADASSGPAVLATSAPAVAPAPAACSAGSISASA